LWTTLFVVGDVGTPASSRSTSDKRQEMTLSSLSRSSEDLSLSDVPPPLPTSPIPTEPFISYTTDLDDVQVSVYILRRLSAVVVEVTGSALSVVELTLLQV